MDYLLGYNQQMVRIGSKNLFIIALVAVVNALGYGIIIPILYSYSKKFGLTDFQNGLLFSIFSICSFISTPIIGRLSDRYGRRPLLLLSLAGTVVSFLMMGLARSGTWLFIARALDGITAGNISVASAVISDTTTGKERGKGFGVIGAAFGFGFVFGPAISAVFVHQGISVPFFVAAIVTFVAFIMTLVLLPETNNHKDETVRHEKLFDFGALLKALRDENMGETLIVSGLYSLAFGLFIYGYQPYAVKVLQMSAGQISLNFTLIGVMGLVSQALIIPRITHKFEDRRILFFSLAFLVLTFAGMGLSKFVYLYMGISLIQALANAFVGPMVQVVLSKETDEKSQGSIMGINGSIASLGMIFGPLIGGVAASINLSWPFFASSLMCIACAYIMWKVAHHPYHKQEVF